MPKYELTYFDGRALGEPLRLIFVAAGVEFVDHRIDIKNEWPTLKDKMGYGQLPLLHVDGVQMTQSLAIGRYLATLFNLLPKDPYQAARCDELLDALVGELRVEFRDFLMEDLIGEPTKAAALKKRLAEEVYPKYYTRFTEIIESAKSTGKFITGDQVCWADLFMASYVELWEELVVTPEFTAKFPRLKKLREDVFALPRVAEYLAKRPKTYY